MMDHIHIAARITETHVHSIHHEENKKMQAELQ